MALGFTSRRCTLATASLGPLTAALGFTSRRCTLATASLDHGPGLHRTALHAGFSQPRGR
eukprot:1404700-Alexandrium_andersonii.AAC.1